MKIKIEDFWVGFVNHAITSRIKVKKDSPIREEGIEEIKEYLRGLWQTERVEITQNDDTFNVLISDVPVWFNMLNKIKRLKGIFKECL